VHVWTGSTAGDIDFRDELNGYAPVAAKAAGLDPRCRSFASAAAEMAEFEEMFWSGDNIPESELDAVLIQQQSAQDLVPAAEEGLRRLFAPPGLRRQRLELCTNSRDRIGVIG
jgi:hypothetical protein